MGRLWLGVFLLLPYGTVAVTVIGGQQGWPMAVTTWCWSLLLLALVAAMALAFLLPRRVGVAAVADTALVMKAAALPFYAGLMWCVVRAALAPSMLLPLVTVAALMLLTSSAYGVSALLQARQAGDLSRRRVLGHLVLQFVPVADVWSAGRCRRMLGSGRADD